MLRCFLHCFDRSPYRFSNSVEQEELQGNHRGGRLEMRLKGLQSHYQRRCLEMRLRRL